MCLLGIAHSFLHWRYQAVGVYFISKEFSSFSKHKSWWCWSLDGHCNWNESRISFIAVEIKQYSGNLHNMMIVIRHTFSKLFNFMPLFVGKCKNFYFTSRAMEKRWLECARMYSMRQYSVPNFISDSTNEKKIKKNKRNFHVMKAAAQKITPTAYKLKQAANRFNHYKREPCFFVVPNKC